MEHYVILNKLQNFHFEEFFNFVYQFSYDGYYQSPTIPTIYNCFRQNSVYLSLPWNIFTFSTAVVTAEWACQNFE